MAPKTILKVKEKLKSWRQGKGRAGFKDSVITSQEEGASPDGTQVELRKGRSNFKGGGGRRKRLLWGGLIALIVLILLGGAGAKATSDSKFCASCHEMTPETATWQVTSHSKISCVTCHSELGSVNYVKGKVNILGLAFKHATGDIPQPITSYHPIQNDVCESCHSTMRKVTASGDILIPHDTHLKQGIACVACHGGVAHGYIAERGLTTQEEYGTWNVAKAEKVSKFDDTKTAMEACLDCHEQVNRGKQPWQDNEGVGKTEKQRVDERRALVQTAAESKGNLEEVAQPVVATSIATNLRAPIRCAPCHSNIKTPFNHAGPVWGTGHGVTARQDVRYCADCHSRQQIRALITPQTDVKDYARSDPFCITCHQKRPSGHLASKKEWLPAHPAIVESKEASNCLTCHDVQKFSTPVPGAKAPATSVICNTCHWFKDNKVEY